jgi:hypothetical protein
LSLVGGQEWADAEANGASSKSGLAELKRRISESGRKEGIGAKLQLEYEALAHAPLEKRVAVLASLAESFKLAGARPKPRIMTGKSTSHGPRVDGVGPDNAMWLAEFALRFASDPVNLDAWAGEHLGASIGRLLETPTLARAARFLVVAIDRENGSIAEDGEFHAGWGWP